MQRKAEARLGQSGTTSGCVYSSLGAYSPKGAGAASRGLIPASSRLDLQGRIRADFLTYEVILDEEEEVLECILEGALESRGNLGKDQGPSHAQYTSEQSLEEPFAKQCGGLIPF